MKPQPDRRELTELTIRGLRPRDASFRVWDTLQQGLCVRVRPSGHKSFEVAYRHEGRLRWFTIGSHEKIGLKKARDVAQEILARVVLGEDPQKEKTDARKGDTLEKFHASYLEEEARSKNKSWRQANKLMKTYILPKLGKRKLKDIQPEDIRQIRKDLRNRPALCNSVLSAISATFSWAVDNEDIMTNPCAGVKRFALKPSPRFLSNDEVRLVWPLFDDLGLYRSIILKVILLTAQRPGEVTHMRWEHVDLDAGWWTMPGEPTDGWPGTKNGRKHEVFLTEPVRELLRDLDPAALGPVFPSNRIPITQSIWEKAGIPRFRPHDLRATAATGMDAIKIVRHHISLVLNHVEGGITAGYIRHDKRQQKRMALEAWADELMAILEGKGVTDQKAEVVPIDQPRRRRLSKS